MDPSHLLDDMIISPDTQRSERLPPNQVATQKWPVLDAAGPPKIDMKQWRFTVSGLVDHEVSWTWDELQKLPRVQVYADFHCVTRWSRLGIVWEGVSTREVLEHGGVLPNAKFVLVHAWDYGWSTNMPLENFLSIDALFADAHDGKPLELEHGGPLRLVVPQLYAWKSAKWVRGIELLENDEAGFWERAGYHLHGDPWREERHRW